MRHSPLTATDPASVGGYELVGRLGSGGMGTVYLGRDRSGTTVAVKLLHERLARDPGFLARFATEAAAAGRVAGFCTARVIEADTSGSRPFLVTEYVDGPSLYEVLSADGPLPASQVEALAVGVAAALTAIHAAGVVHRDLKPSNVMLSNFGPKVIDFGVARALGAGGDETELGFVVGTPGWMAPEQLHGSSTAASDVFVWGLLIAHAGTWWRPAPLLQVTMPSPGDLATLPENLAGAVSAALSLRPERRPSARDLLLRLCGSAESAPVRTATAVLSRPWDAPYPTAAPPSGAQPPGRTPSQPPAPSRPTGTRPPTQPWPPIHGRPPAHGRPTHGHPPVHGRSSAWPGRRPPAHWQSPPPPIGAYRIPPQPPVASGKPPRRRRRFRGKKRLTLLALVVIVVVALNSGDEPGATLPPNTARDGILEFTVVEWQCGLSSLGPPGLARQAQGQLCTVQLRVRNFGDASRRVHVGSQDLHDAAGRTFDADDGAWVYLEQSVPFFREEINPGNEITATLVFDIAADATPQRLEVHDSPFSGGAEITL